MAWMVGSYHHLPLWVAEGKGARFTDVDGHEYRDFNIADLSMFCGYAPEPLVRAVSDRIARGNQFLLPVEDAIVVSEELGRRFGLPKWQYTSSATHANTEAIRVARVATGRDRVLMFDGKYHGHLDEALVELDEDGQVVAEERGIPGDTVGGTVLVPFNDPAALARALERRDIAIVLTEPAITNNIGLLLPDDGFHAELRRLTRETGTLLAIDETHTQVVGPGGLTAAVGPRARLRRRSASRSPAALPFGAWGTTEEIADAPRPAQGPGRGALEPRRDRRHDLRQRARDGGGAGRDDRDPHARGLRAHAAPGRAARRRDARVRRARTGCRGTSRTSARGPATRSSRRPIHDAAEGRAAADELLTRLIRVWLANRGVWEAIVGAGPVCSGPVPGRGRRRVRRRLGRAARRPRRLKPAAAPPTRVRG